MSEKLDLAHIRRDYESPALSQSDLLENPIQQFQVWFEEWLKTNPFEPTAMSLSTVDENNCPDSRVVLLKDIWEEQFVFFTNYQSAKGKQIAKNPQVALLFYWPELFREVRIRGVAKFLPELRSDEYFATRPFASQCSALVSPQSQVIDDLQKLQEKLAKTQKEFQSQNLKRPKHWGGYAVKPFEIEFWQGQKGRFHDRFLYQKLKDQWIIQRLAP
jgi:pyridoxamine 5'-phosphate oxidase